MTFGHTLLSGSEKLLLREVFTSVQDSESLLEYICTFVFELVHIWFLDRKLIMEIGFLDKVEDNAAVRSWSETTQREEGDSLAEGYISELWDFTSISWVIARIKQNGDNNCISWRNLKDIVLVHLDAEKRVEVFALSIYGLIIFPRALGHVDKAVTDLFNHLDKGVTSVPAILAEIFRSLNVCRKRVRVDSLDVHSCFLRGSTVIFGKLIRCHIWSFLKAIRH
ncbi:hypothetical protein Goshw_009212 [Gossypium schwendimanii]|uniref:DUF7745 domain-containing protein n=1 Tax=Gossypium schwendimanii TaxID=34291 RepID=A0A7J9N8W4_GOSSC|nr:hypothetical protein [Gossypium schwendimanii]